jgi:hypothetical protein
MTKLITNSIQNEENRVRNFALKYERVLFYIRLVEVVEILNIVLLSAGVLLNNGLSKNGGSIYRSLTTMFIANAVFIVILCPALFDGVRELKFSQEKLKEVELQQPEKGT